MLVEERRQRILDLVSRQGSVALSDLAQLIQVSESTLRRDLDYWHQQGVLKRTHGGAIYVGDNMPLPALEDRSTSQLDEKRLIAKAAAARIPGARLETITSGGHLFLKHAHKVREASTAFIKDVVPKPPAK